MKTMIVQKIIRNNHTLKIISFFLAGGLWYSSAFDQKIIISYTIPLCFDLQEKEYQITAPENITIFLYGSRNDFLSLDPASLAAHVTLDKILPGSYGIILKDHHLLLPSTITLQKYQPSDITVTIVDTITPKESFHD